MLNKGHGFVCGEGSRVRASRQNTSMSIRIEIQYEIRVFKVYAYACVPNLDLIIR